MAVPQEQHEQIPGGYGTPFQVAEMPAPPPFSFQNLVKFVGVSAILVSVSIGSGEWLIGPGVTAKYGVSILWIVTLATILQTVFNLENIRYSLATGEPSVVGMTRIWPGPKLWTPVWIVLAILSVGPGWALAASTALAAMVLNRMPADADKGLVVVLGIGLMVLVMGILLFGERVARTLERLSKAAVAIIFVGLIALNVGFVPFSQWVEVAGGFFQFGFLPTAQAGVDWGLVGAFAAYAALGGIFNITVGSYTRDKGWGMGSKVGYIPALIGSQRIGLSTTGTTFHPTEGNVSRFQEWFRYAKWEQFVLFTGGCLIGMYLSVLLATAMIPAGTDISGWAVAAHQAQGVAKVLGAFGWFFVLFIGVWALWGTQLGCTEMVVRNITDLLWSTYPSARKFSEEDVRKIYYAIMVVITIWMGYQFIVGTPLGLVKFVANMAGVVFFVGGITLLITNLTILPKAIRPGIAAIAGLVGLALFYGFFASRALLPGIWKALGL